MARLISFSLAFSFLAWAGRLSADPVVIVNPECAASGDIELVRKLFLGKEKALCGGNTAQVLDVDESNPMRAVFLEKVVGKSASELRQYWSRLLFTGKASPPRNVGDDAAVKSFVAKNKDAIGIIDSKVVDASVKTLVKIQ